ncbi:MAG: DUF6163 family protein [Pseudomonadota bacterium]
MSGFNNDDLIDNPFLRAPKPQPLSIFGLPVFVTFLRVLSMVVLGIAIYVWAHSIGFFGRHLIDSFVADNHTAIVEGILTVVLPALAVGLWLGASWGFFLWGLCAIGVIFTHFAIEQVTFSQYILGSFLMVALALYCGGLIILALSRMDWKPGENTNKS